MAPDADSQSREPGELDETVQENGGTFGVRGKFVNPYWGFCYELARLGIFADGVELDEAVYMIKRGFEDKKTEYRMQAAFHGLNINE